MPQRALIGRTYAKRTMAADVVAPAEALGFDAAARWRAWADDLDHRTVSCGHVMAEKAPEEVIKAIRDLLARRPAV